MFTDMFRNMFRNMLRICVNALKPVWCLNLVLQQNLFPLLNASVAVLRPPASRNQSPSKPGKRSSQVNLAVIPRSVTQFPETQKPLSDQQPNPSHRLPSRNAKYVHLASPCAEFNKAVNTFTSLFTPSTPASKERRTSARNRSPTNTPRRLCDSWPRYRAQTPRNKAAAMFPETTFFSKRTIELLRAERRGDKHTKPPTSHAGKRKDLNRGNKQS